MTEQPARGQTGSTYPVTDPGSQEGTRGAAWACQSSPSREAAPDWAGDWDGTEADMDRRLAARLAQAQRMDEESLVLGLTWPEAVCLTHEATEPWRYATADRFYRAGGWRDG